MKKPTQTMVKVLRQLHAGHAKLYVTLGYRIQWCSGQPEPRTAAWPTVHGLVERGLIERKKLPPVTRFDSCGMAEFVPTEKGRAEAERYGR